MLRCMCGKRFSASYDVNKVSRESIKNGVIKPPVDGKRTDSPTENKNHLVNPPIQKTDSKLLQNGQIPVTPPSEVQSSRTKKRDQVQVEKPQIIEEDKASSAIRNTDEVQFSNTSSSDQIPPAHTSKTLESDQISSVVEATNHTNEVQSSKTVKSEKIASVAETIRHTTDNINEVQSSNISSSDHLPPAQLSETLKNDQIPSVAETTIYIDHTNEVQSFNTSGSDQLPPGQFSKELRDDQIPSIAETNHIDNTNEVQTSSTSAIDQLPPVHSPKTLKNDQIPSVAETTHIDNKNEVQAPNTSSIDQPPPVQSPKTLKNDQIPSVAETAHIDNTNEVQASDTSSIDQPPPVHSPKTLKNDQTQSAKATSHTITKSDEIQTAETQIISEDSISTVVEDVDRVQSSNATIVDQISSIPEEPRHKQISHAQQNYETSTIETSSVEISETKKPEQAVTNKETQSKPKAPQPPQQKSDKTDVVSKTEPERVNGGDDIAGTDPDLEKQTGDNEGAGTSTGKSKSKKKSEEPERRRSGIIPLPVNYDEDPNKLKPHPKSSDDESLIREAIERNDFLYKIINGKRLDDVVNAMYRKDIPAKTTIVKQGDKGTHMYISAKGKFQVLIKNKAVSEFSDVRVFGELAILYNAKRLATVKTLTSCKVWVLDYQVYQQITVRHNIKRQDEIMEFLLNNEKLKVVGKEALLEVASLLKSEFFKPGTQIVRQGDKGNTFYIIRAGTVTITKDGEGVVGLYKKGDCFGELALLKEDCRQATVTADVPGVECLTLSRKEFVDHFGELKDWEYINIRPKDSFRDGVTEHEDIDLRDLRMIKTLGVGGFGRVELVQHKKKGDLVFALKYLKKIDIVMQHQQEHVYNEKNIQMACKSLFIVRLYRTYKDNKYIYLLMESCLGGDLWSLLQKQKLRRFDEKEAKFIAGCVLEAFEYLHSRGIIYRDLKPENLLIAVNGYIKLTDFGFAKKISSRGKTFTFAGTPEYVAPEIVLNRGHDRSVDYWAFGAFIFELLTGRTPFRTDDSSHMKTYNKILSGIDNVQFPSYVNLKARHIVEKLCRPVPSERLGMQRGGIKDIKAHRWFLGFDWLKFAKCEMPSPFKPKLKSQIDTQYFDQFKKDTDVPPDEISGWDSQF